MNELLAGARGERLAYDDYVASAERELYDKGEDFETFYQREIAPLAPPVR
jgi:hypothetical protein